MSLPTFTKEQQEIVDHVQNLIPENGHHIYDLRDEKQYQYACLMHEINGISKEKYPATHKLLDDTRAHQEKFGYNPTPLMMDSTPGWTTNYDITGAGKNSTGKAAGAGLGSVVGGFNSLNLSIYIQDTANKTILASGGASAFTPSTTQTVETNPETAYPITPNYTTYLHYSCVPKPNPTLDVSIPPGNIGTVSRQGSNDPVADPTVIHPKYTVLSNPYGGATNNILIGLGRPWDVQSTQFNYVWAEPAKAHPLGRVPLVGKVTFTKEIAALALPTVSDPGNITVGLSVTDLTSGGVISPTADEFYNTIYPSFSLVSGDSKSLQWNLPPGTSSSDIGTPILFTNIIWPSDMTALFNCDIQITFTDGELGFASISSTPSGTDNNPLDGTTYIHPIEFIWHCLGEGTQVTLKDGKSTKAIETFITGDHVVSNGDGEQKIISAVHKGAHKGEILSITTNKGQSLIISHNHLVMTPEGGKRASDLELGDNVLVECGTASIIELDREIDYSGNVYNLYVGEYTDEEPGSFFANGILVGDIVAQSKMTEQLTHDMGWIISELGDEWAVDVQSYFTSKQ